MPDTIQIFTFLFLMLGPFKIIGPFVKMSKGTDPALMRGIAIKAAIFATLGLLITAFIGESLLAKFGIPVSILALTGGLILFLVALSNVLQQYTPSGADVAHEPPTTGMAMTPLAFPTIVTPYGIAAVIVFMAISPDLHSQLVIGAIIIGIMALNLLMMLLTRFIGKLLFLGLSLLGSVLGVIQVALGLMIIYNQVKVLFNLS